MMAFGGLSTDENDGGTARKAGSGVELVCREQGLTAFVQTAATMQLNRIQLHSISKTTKVFRSFVS
jgi:hypothetical protein